MRTLRDTCGAELDHRAQERQIRALIKGEALQLGLFDERNLFELTHPDYRGERLLACRNPELARLRAHKRTALLEATDGELGKMCAHIFLCMLAYYVEWHLRQAWRELLFADEDQAAKAERDPFPQPFGPKTLSVRHNVAPLRTAPLRSANAIASLELASVKATVAS